MTAKPSNNQPANLAIPKPARGGRNLQRIFTRRFTGAFGIPGLVLAVMLLAAAPASAWEHWGGDRGGTRFSKLAQITPANVGNLVRAWEFRTGDLDTRLPALMARTKSEATPLFVEDSLIFCTPFNEVIALDPGSGAQKWRYDPKVDTSRRPGNRFVCRGVAHWVDDQAAEGAACRSAGYSWAPTTSASSRSTPGPEFPASISATNGEVTLDIGKPLRLARRIPDHLGAGGEPRRGRRRLFDLGQCPRRCAARHRARI